MDEQLCVCAIAKQETPYVLEWVAHQRIIGATQVIIYDNGHDARGQRLLADLDRHGVIVHLPWTGEFAAGPQIPAYNDALMRLSGSADWVLFVDLDEFLMPMLGSCLLDILNSADELDGIWFPWCIFGSSGETKMAAGSVTERFLHRQHIDDTTVTPVKSAVRPHRTRRADVHVHELVSEKYGNPRKETEFLTTKDGLRRSAQLARGHEIARVHHYMTKSKREWMAKVERGRADRGYAHHQRSRDLGEFATWDRNEVFDDTATRFRSDLRAEIKLISRLIRLRTGAPGADCASSEHVR